MSVPPHLYKYESLNIYSLENLKGRTLYFSSPLKFNDPYDCALFPNIRPLSDEDVERIRCKDLGDPSKSRKWADISATSTEDLRKIYLEAGHSAFRRHVDEFLHKSGVTCFSERNDNLLMWAHYGGRYKGFCLEFSTKLLPSEKMKQVKYPKDIPTIDLVPLLVENDYVQVDELFYTKSKDWHYEHEWRGFMDQAGTSYRYSTDSLTGVYFGPHISDRSLEIIYLILGGQKEVVKFWRGKRSSTEFKVEFEQFT